MKNDGRIIFLSCMERFLFIFKVLERSLWWSAGSGWAVLVLLFDLFRAWGWDLVKRWLERTALPWKLGTTRAPHTVAASPSPLPKMPSKTFSMARWDILDCIFPTSVEMAFFGWHQRVVSIASYQSIERKFCRPVPSSGILKVCNLVRVSEYRWFAWATIFSCLSVFFGKWMKGGGGGGGMNWRIKFFFDRCAWLSRNKKFFITYLR